VAIAIWRSRPSWVKIRWDQCDIGFQTGMRAEARAAIAAMREPTDEMRDEFYVGNYGDADNAWQAMIDAALK
jgi:hypothetical protein